LEAFIAVIFQVEVFSVMTLHSVVVGHKCFRGPCWTFSLLLSSSHQEKFKCIYGCCDVGKVYSW